MSEKPDTTHLSKESNRMIDIIQENDLNKVSGLKIKNLVQDLTSHEQDMPYRASSSVKTAAIVGVVVAAAQMAEYMDSTADQDYDHDSPANKERNKVVDVEVQAILKAAYNDPIVNPSKPIYGDGYFDIQTAQTDLKNGKDISSMVMPKGMTTDNKEILLTAVGNLPVSLQQFAVQGMRMAADDAKKQEHIGSMKTTSLLHSQDVISDSLDAYQSVLSKAGQSMMGRTLTERFDIEIYNARGLKQYETIKNDPNAESNKPLKQIRLPLGNSLNDTIRDGLNNDLRDLKKLSQGPHTKSSDFRIKDIARSIADNSVQLASKLDSLFDHEMRKPEGISADKAHAYIDSQTVLDSAREMIKEMPERDLMLERSMDIARDKFQNTDTAYSKIQQNVLLQLHLQSVENQPSASPATPPPNEPAVNRGPSGP